MLAYAPAILAPRRPWLFELDELTGSTVACHDDGVRGPLHTRRDRAPTTAHPSLAAACAAHQLDAARDIELRWWRDCTLATVVSLELVRLGRSDLAVSPARDGGVIVSLGERTHPVPDSFALRRFVVVLQRRLAGPARVEAATAPPALRASPVGGPLRW